MRREFYCQHLWRDIHLETDYYCQRYKLKLASHLGLKTMRYPEDIAWGIELDIKSPGLGKPKMFEYYIGNHAPGWKTTYAQEEAIMPQLGLCPQMERTQRLTLMPGLRISKA